MCIYVCIHVRGSNALQRPCVFVVYRGEKGEYEMVVCTPRGV